MAVEYTDPQIRMQHVGTVQSIWRYPVKGMAGESLRSCPLGSNGLHGDRIWALQDLERQEIQSCKFRPELLRCSAACAAQVREGAAVRVTFPDGEVLYSDTEQANARLSALIGRPSRLQRLRPLEEDPAFYHRYKADDHTWLEELKGTFEREPGEPLPDLDNLPPEAQQNVSVPGTFFLVAPLHILTTASLAHMRAVHPDADWALERFRPNVVVETLPGMEGLVEQGWIGQGLWIGESRVDCVATAPRCGAVVRPQRDFGEDKSILRSIVREADQNLGIYGSITQPASVSVGEPVYLDLQRA